MTDTLLKNKKKKKRKEKKTKLCNLSLYNGELHNHGLDLECTKYYSEIDKYIKN